ncbi:MAG: DinB family protein [Planctomycetes bacterium]|nr:DinB family protein [Planctomycetota bacterium]
MNPNLLIEFLRRFPEHVTPLVANLDEGTLHHRPGPASWSVLEIVGHLLDEERKDFRPRLQSLLEDPGREWRPIAPAQDVVDGAYHERALGELLAAFVEERGRSLAWLDDLRDPDWNLTYQHRTLGPIQAGDLLLSWASHDLLHVKQITRRVFESLADAAKSYSSSYAGSWSS